MPGQFAVQSPASSALTLSIDIGGTHIKAGVLRPNGELLARPVSTPTPAPASPGAVLDTIHSLMLALPRFDRISIGFPGVVRDGHVIDAWRFTVSNDGTIIDDLVATWESFDITSAIASRLQKPALVVNDAAMHGAAVIDQTGLHLVLTLGTGFGTALFNRGVLLPHIDLAFHTFRDDENYDEQLGQTALDTIGIELWTERLMQAVQLLARVFHYDRLYIGGGNSRLIKVRLGPRVTVMDNSAALFGGVNLWNLSRLD